jgi:mediator of RNA polymerase II transcription subunit 17
LQNLCPPYKDGYPDVRALGEYLHTATVRLLTEHALSILSSSTSSGWNRSIKGTSLRLPSEDTAGDLELHFLVNDSSDGDDASAPVLVLQQSRLGAGQQRWEWRAEGPSESRSLADVLHGVGDATKNLST